MHTIDKNYSSTSLCVNTDDHVKQHGTSSTSDAGSSNAHETAAFGAADHFTFGPKHTDHSIYGGEQIKHQVFCNAAQHKTTKNHHKSLEAPLSASVNHQVYFTALSYQVPHEQAMEAATSAKLDVKIYFTALSPSYRRTHQEALEAATSDIDLQVYFTCLTPSYRLSHKQALRASMADVDSQILFTALSPSYQLSFEDAFQAATAKIDAGRYFHNLVLGHTHASAMKLSR